MNKFKKADNKYIPLSVPIINGNEWKYVKECLDSGWVSSAGKYVNQFEEKIAEYTGAKYAIACVNGTSALHVSLRLAGVEPGNEVIVPTITFIAPINAVKYLNANPVFMDTDNYHNIDSEKTIEFIKKETKFKGGYSINKKTGKIIKAIIPVHVFGNAVWLDDLFAICRDRNIKIVEDASESLGTRYKKGRFKGKHTGTIGEFGCLSFNGNKIITTGGGGMILTNDKNLADKAKYLTTQAKDDGEKYIHNDIGYNYRLTNIQAALGVAQLERLDEFIKIKQNNFSFYKKGLSKCDFISLNETPDYANCNRWLYTLLVIKAKTSSISNVLTKNGIQTRPLWFLNHLQKMYKTNQSYNIVNAINLYSDTLCLPSSVSLKRHEILRITKLINTTN
jgi:aminotransferase in exopolysaccharide biosynthesis